MVRPDLQPGDLIWFVYNRCVPHGKWIQGVFLRWTEDGKGAVVSEWFKAFDGRKYGHHLFRDYTEISETIPETHKLDEDFQKRYPTLNQEAWPK